MLWTHISAETVAAVSLWVRTNQHFKTLKIVCVSEQEINRAHCRVISLNKTLSVCIYCMIFG